jgi:hypothetical protein
MKFYTEFLQITSLEPSIYGLQKTNSRQIETLAVEHPDGNLPSTGRSSTTAFLEYRDSSHNRTVSGRFGQAFGRSSLSLLSTLVKETRNILER